MSAFTYSHQETGQWKGKWIVWNSRGRIHLILDSESEIEEFKKLAAEEERAYNEAKAQLGTRPRSGANARAPR